jgi:hypothetical protein
MIDHNDFESNSADNLLSASTIPWTDAELWQSVLAQTTRVLRRRRRVRRITFVVALLGCYAAGMGTMRLCTNGSGERALVIKEKESGISKPTLVERTPEGPLPPNPQLLTAALVPVDQDPDAPATVLEQVAAVSKDGQAGLYRLAGDRYFEEAGDVQAALRCYRRALDSASADDLAISENDNWLLIELKKARLEGKNHAQSGG